MAVRQPFPLGSPERSRGFDYAPAHLMIRRTIREWGHRVWGDDAACPAHADHIVAVARSSAFSGGAAGVLERKGLRRVGVSASQHTRLPA
jgi:hypothetical protein